MAGEGLGGTLAEARALGITVIPKTINDPPTMVKLLDMGVDGIISDRPDVLKTVLLGRGEWVG